MTMPFDGVKYRDASYTLPTYYHPKAAFQAQALSNCLRNSYFAAGHNSRLILQQVYGTNFEDLQANDERVTVRSMTDRAIAKGRAFIPLNVTHCRAAVSFSALALGMSSANFLIECVPDTQGGGKPSAVGSSEVEIESNVSGGWHFNAAQEIGDITPARAVTVQADLSEIELGQACTITVSVNAAQKGKTNPTQGWTTSGSDMLIQSTGHSFSAGEFVIFSTPKWFYRQPPPFDNWHSFEIQATTSTEVEITERPTDSFPGDEQEGGTLTLTPYPIPIRPHFVSVFLGVD